MTGRWRVVRQSSGTQVCAHHYQIVAYWCAWRWTRRTPIGVFFDVRPAVTE